LQAEALARPGEVIKRSRGDEAAMLGREPTARPERKPSRPPAPPDRSRLNAAELGLSQAKRGLSAKLDALAAERAGLDGREIETRSEGDARLKALGRERDEAEAAYARAVETSAKARRR